MSKVKKSQLLLRITIVTCAGLFVYFIDDILRIGWNIWTGNPFHWRGVDIPLAATNFVFPYPKDDYIVIGSRHDSDDVFPNDSSVLVIKDEAPYRDKIRANEELCEQQSCTSFNVSSISNNEVFVLTITGQLFDFSGKHHLIYMIPASCIMIEFHGNEADLENYAAPIDALLDSARKGEISCIN